jgi:ribonuclease T2
MLRKLTVLAGAAILVGQVSAAECPSEAVASCSEEATTLDSCCVSRPGGLFLFRQRFEADEGDDGRWGIDGLDVLK